MSIQPEIDERHAASAALLAAMIKVDPHYLEFVARDFARLYKMLEETHYVTDGHDSIEIFFHIAPKTADLFAHALFVHSIAEKTVVFTDGGARITIESAP